MRAPSLNALTALEIYLFDEWVRLSLNPWEVLQADMKIP